MSPCASRTCGRSGATGGLAGATFTRSTIEAGLVCAGQLECAFQQLLDRRLFDVRGCAKRHEPGVFARPLQQSAAVVELSPAIEEDRRMTRKCTDADDILAVRREADDLPHHAFGAWRLHLVGDLLCVRGDLPHGLESGLDRRTHGARDLTQLARNCDHLTSILAC